jgi:hypothetical protein
VTSRLILYISGTILVFILSACTPAPTYTDYYVSISGSDSSGNGSQSKPWRTIQYALDHANYAGTSTVTINLAKGIYNENIVIKEEVIIRGAGSSETVSTTTANPLVPMQNVSVITRQIPADLPSNETVKSVYANGAGTVRLENLNVFGGGVTSEDSDFEMENVIVNGVTGFYGVQVSHSSFSILNSRIETQIGFYSDYGLSVVASSGFFTNSYVGAGFDHTINIEPWATSDKIDVYNLPIPINIYITESTIEGSPIWYADGIRIQGPANVVIRDTLVFRGPEGEPAKQEYTLPHAGIEVAGWMLSSDLADNKMRRVDIINVETYGFDVGIGLTLSTYEVKVEGSSINGRTYGVQTIYNEVSSASFPTVDFGGGPLGSKGKNVFSNKPQLAYNHKTGPYPVFACFNNWNVAVNSIDPSRIFDKLDDSKLGRVTWDCSTISESQGSLIAIPNENVNCREGNNSSLFDVVEFLAQGTEYTPIARGVDNQWLLFRGTTTNRDCWSYVGEFILLLDGNKVGINVIPENRLPFASYPGLPGPSPTPTPKESRDDQGDVIPTPCQVRYCP